MCSTKKGRRKMNNRVIRRIDVVTMIVRFIKVRWGFRWETNAVGATMVSGRVARNAVLLSSFSLMRRAMKIGMTTTRTRLTGARKK